MGAEVHCKKSKGVFKATIKHHGVSVVISFDSHEEADDEEMEEGVKLFYAVLTEMCGATEAARIFLGLSEILK